MQPRQLTTPQEAVARIRDGAIVSFNGIGMIGLAEQFFLAAEARFLSEGHPRNLTLYSACGLGGSGENAYITRLAHPGMVSRAIVGYIAPYAVFAPAILSGEMEGYNLPQGIISTNYRAAAARHYRRRAGVAGPRRTRGSRLGFREKIVCFFRNPRSVFLDPVRFIFSV